MNYNQLAGHLGADPEERRTPSGKKVTNLRLAVNIWVDGKEEALWWMVSVWGDEFDNIIKHMKKGSAICVVGTMRKPRIYTDREGKPQVALELNARMLSFSPFGKTDRPVSEAHASSYQRTPSTAPNFANAHAAGGSDVDFGMAPFGASFGAPSSGHRYDAPGGGGVEGDEEMPF